MDEVFLTSQIGTCQISATQKGISSIRFVDDCELSSSLRSVSNPHLLLAIDELKRYFEGRLTRFSCTIDVAGTPFQKQVWASLSAIPFGVTKSYGQIANEIGKPGASRAVGGANNRNPIPVIVPCHRVIGGAQELVGFGCGLWRKQWLLEHEGIALPLS